jgi:hypothetical protein
VHGLLPILEQTLGYKQALPERKLRSMEELVERFPNVKEVILDGTAGATSQGLRKTEGALLWQKETPYP